MTGGRLFDGDGLTHHRVTAVHLRCAVDPLVAFYDINGRKGEVLFFNSVPDTTRDKIFLFPTLIPLSGVGTTYFSSCCDKDSTIIFTTDRLPDIYPP
jgi:hypothetical protein